MDRAIVIVPIYKKDMSEFEAVSWQQLHKILYLWPICLVVPERMAADFNNENNHRLEFFPDRYFLSTKTYSQLLLSSEFYSRFIDYEYMLIYQLDAFVFYDRLEYFCSLNYDYIGAPVDKRGRYWHDLGIYVGNGGFSLRKIDAMLRVLKIKNHIMEQHPLADVFNEKEDLYFAYCGTIAHGLKVADVSTALQFSIEDDIRHCYKNMARKLPFGVHWWHKDKYAICKPIVESYGYVLPDVSPNLDVKRYRKRLARNYFEQRIKRMVNWPTLANLVRTRLLEGEYAIWGFGEEGKFWLEFLAVASIRIVCVFDQSADDYTTKCNDIFPIKPTKENVQLFKRRLLICSLRYEEEISNILIKDMGFSKDDFEVCRKLYDSLFILYLSFLKAGKHNVDNPRCFGS